MFSNLEKLSLIKLKKYLPLVLLLLVAFFLRLPSFFETHWYFDEGLYSLFGKSIIKGEIPYLYIWDHKPIGMYLIYAFCYLLPFDILLGAKILAFISCFTSSILLYLIAKQSFNAKIAFIAALIFAVMSSLPFFDGNQANGEVFFLPLVLLSIYLIQPFTNKITKYKLVIAGFSLATAFFIKQVAGIDLILILFLLTFKKGSFLKHVFYLFLGLALTSLVILSINLALGSPFKEIWFSNITFNLSYVVSRKIGILFTVFKILLLAITFLLIFFKERLPYVPILLWFLVDSIAVLAGGQPYPHYLIQVMPISSLIIALYISKNYHAKLIKYLGAILITFFLFIPLNSYFRFISYGDVFKEWDYYSSFTKSATNIDKNAFNDLFSKRWGIDRNKKVVSYLNSISSENDSVYIWGGGTTTWLYYDLDRRLPSRYISFLHIEAIPKAQNETIKTLTSNEPKFILSTPHPTFKTMSNLIEDNYTPVNVIDDMTIYKLN